MSYIYYAAITRALRAGKVKEAAPMEQSGQPNCDKVRGNGEFSPNTQRGSGEGNGIYQHFSSEQGVIFEIESPWDRNQWRWARLFSRKYDDLLGWYDYEENDHRFGVWKNSGDGAGKFTRIGDLHGNIYCIPRGLRFADVDGDGLDDIVCVSPTGDLHVSRNTGDGDRGSSRLPTFKYLGKIMTGKAEQSRIRLADIDGDGRVDYGVVHEDSGAVEFWRNSGTGETPGFWQHLGIRSTMVPGPWTSTRNAGIRFEDINGDGRDDYMWMSDYWGETTTYTNARSCQKGREGNGLNVAWRQAFFRGQNSGSTHGGIRHVYPNRDLDDDKVRERIHFARIYGREESFAYRDQSVKDYVFMEPTEGDDKKFKFKVHAWKNLGSGGTKLEADGNKYCNMHGWSDGRADYVWVRSTGEMDLYPSRGLTQVGSGSFWEPWVPGFWKPPQNIDRRELHLADWNGDGACDIIWADPKRNHRVTVWINNYPKTKSWNNAFTQLQNPPDLQCNDRNGIGIHDNAVQFAYLGNDNRRADYLCIRENGLVRGRRQLNDGSFGPMVQFKKAEGVDRANIRWGDVNGDGRDDLIWVDKFNGNARVWYGAGPHGNPSANGGSSWQWRKIDEPVYDGSYAGTCQYFPDLNGNGRADLHSIMGTWTNKAETWFNRDCALRDAHGDDPGGDPQLPVQPGNPIDGDGPGDGDHPGCDRESDSRDFRDFDCNDPLVANHSEDEDIIKAWSGLDVLGAWRSSLDWWHCKRAESDVSGFSNVISDFFNGPQGFRCEIFAEVGNCGGGNALQCDDVRWPAGYFILNWFRNIASINRDWDNALQDLSDYTQPDNVATTFGMRPDDTNPRLAILLDVVVMGYSMVMGPIWNRGMSTQGRTHKTC
ncbi:uncharacterized protein F5Z01DRAFT_531189 [Emericellopsis atlantica]|uniref:VCBS repeat-containing protein n=1 Tax=Emericellopsis atlantica TaxID=2614577 RepID=A0A9P8CQT0_9HYPO|nr:uncharacterized protein F5Z01DRAFT_531189 [Emericellopsis atlantica]KAG9255973.1 hypothetical protein F5Z01DRAFT_531189 [Emericellopsis atlantica]